MTKGEFIKYIAKKYDCSQTEAQNIINIFTESVVGAISEGNEVLLGGFGSFHVTKAEARTGRNPATGKAIDIPARNHLRFKVSDKLRAIVNKR